MQERPMHLQKAKPWYNGDTDDDCVYMDRLVEQNFETQKRIKNTMVTQE